MDPASAPEVTVIWTGPGAHVVRLLWRPIGSQADQERFHALRLRDGKIREMSAYRTVGQATRIAKRWAEKGE